MNQESIILLTVVYLFIAVLVLFAHIAAETDPREGLIYSVLWLIALPFDLIKTFFSYVKRGIKGEQ